MSLAINIVMGANTANFSRNVKKATDNAKKELGGLAGFAKSAFDKIGALNLIGGALSIGHITKVADEMQSLASKVRLATQSTEEYKAVQNELRQIALEQRSSFAGIVDLYSSSQRALAALGKSQQDVVDFTRNFTTAMNVAGASSEAQAATLLQLGQALNMGVLRGQEFNTIAAQTPVVMDLIAKKMNVTIGELKDLGAKGAITAEVIYDAVAGATDELNAAVSKMPPTISAALQTVKDSFGFMVHDIINESTGLSSHIANVIAFIGQNLRTLVTVAGIAAAAIGVNMARSWLLAKTGAVSLTAAIGTKTSAMLASIGVAVREAQFTATQISLTNMYQQRLIVLSMTKNAYINALKTALATTVAYTRALPAKIAGLKASTTALLANARATLTVANAQKVALTGGVLLGRGVSAVGSAFASLGRIILAHPIMAIAAVISTVIVRTMGLQKALDSLSDAFSVLGMALGDLVDWAVDGFGSMLDASLSFLSGFLGSSGETTNGVTGFFSDMFAGTEGGFVGLVQVAASCLDSISAFAVTTCKYIATAFGNMGVAISNVFKGVINFAASVFEKGINNTIIKPINTVIEGFNKVSSFLGGGTISTIGTVSVGRVEMGSYQANSFDVSANNTGSFRSKIDGYIVATKQAKTSSDALAGSHAAVGKAADNAGKATGKNSKAKKDNSKKTKENTKEQESLTKALQEQYAEWRKLRYEMAHPLNLELDKINYEIEFGKFKGVSDAIKAQLREEAKKIDSDIINDELTKLIHETNIDGKMKGKETLFDKLLGDVENGRHKFSLFKDSVEEWNDETGERTIKIVGKLGEAFEQMALSDLHDFSFEASQSILDNEKQLEILNTKGDFNKQMLAFEHEYQATLDKYASLAMLEDKSAYNQLKERAEEVRLSHEKLAAQSAYQDILSDLQSDEDKKLATLQNQLAVIAKQVQLSERLNGIDTTDNLKTALAVLDKSLGLTQSEPTAFGKLNGEYQNRLAQVQAFLESQRQLYQDNADELERIEQAGKERLLAVEKSYNQAKANLLLTTLSEQSAAAAEGMKSAFGEQSKAYRAMFTLQQSFAIGTALLNVKTAISDAFARSKDWASRLSNIALATSEGMKIVSAIKQIQNPVVGQAHDGIMSVPKSGTWNLEKGERVLPKHTAKALDDRLNRLDKGGETKVIINNYTGEKASVDKQADGSLLVTIGQMIDGKINQWAMNERRQGGLMYGR